MQIRTVFLSSTARDLQEYREAAYKAIEGLDGYHCVRMEDFGARDQEADEFCAAKVAECDLFVGIVGTYTGAVQREARHRIQKGSIIPQRMPVNQDLFSLRLKTFR